MESKIGQAIRRIQTAYNRWGDGLFLGHSGGKDSCVIFHLTQQVFQPLVIHNPKSETHEETVKFLYGLDYPVLYLPVTQMEWYIRQRALGCQIDGSREAESTRQGKSTTVIQQGQERLRKGMSWTTEDGVFGLAVVYPIYDWTDQEVWEYIKQNQLPVSKEYEIHDSGTAR